MITIKFPAEIKLIKEGGKRLSRILRQVVKFCRAGVTTEEIDRLAESLILKAGAEPAFRGYKVPGSPPFPSVICISINNEVVHAPATPGRILKNGDVVGLDIGMRWPERILNSEFRIQNSKQIINPKSETLNHGYYTDMAVTVGIGKISREARELMKVTRSALERGLRVVRPGNLISDIGRQIEEYVKKFGFGIVRDLVGHGVGYKLHEEPAIPNYFDSRLPQVKLKQGMVLAIEPMITLGSGEVRTLADKWTVVSREGGLAAHFEVTIVVTKRGHKIVTPLP